VWKLRHGDQVPSWSGDVCTDDFFVAGLWSLMLMQVTLAIFGGNAIAGERTDRSAEFLGSLPISRGRKLASKLWVGLGLWTLGWVPNLVVMTVLWLALGADVRLTLREPIWPVMSGIAVTGLTFFCVAWMFSAMLESPTVAGGAGFLTPPLVGMCVLWGGYELAHYLGRVDLVVDGRFPFLSYLGTCLLLSIVCFTVGTRYYLRRVEP
jgi:hypothetical protein